MKALFLDAAGTLFDLAEPVGQVYARFARQHGLVLEAGEAESRFRSAFQEQPAPDYHDQSDGHQCEIQWWRTLVLRVVQADDDARFEAFFQAVFAYYEQPQAWQLFPDTLPFLSQVQSRYRLAVVSNFDARLVPILAGLELTSFFEVILSSAEARARKPDRAIFDLALQKMGLAPQEALHIGDSFEADYEGARAAGLAAFHLRREQGQTLADALSEA